ncbi:hypothetical protein AB9P05_14965 [Roseivirga sp. BDSF3-8]|uniref:hypothetical protein n=1 Tax=Roseivirga sp. BDSF3-8 TaxID=3241598 RepID=UPI003532294F
MKYQILQERYNQASHNIRIIFKPENEVLNAFFSTLRINKTPSLLDKISNSENYYQELMSLRFYKNLDWEELEELLEIGGIKEGEVAIYHEVYGEITLNESIFKQLVLDYSQELLEVYRNDSSLPDSWDIQMTNGIIKLKNKSSQS